MIGLVINCHHLHIYWQFIEAKFGLEILCVCLYLSFVGVSFQMQERAIRSGVHILVATPGRALDHISRGTIDLSNVKHVVLDEGDTMLEMGFQKDVETIIMNVKAPGEEARKKATESLSSDNDRWDIEDEDDDVKAKSDRDVQMLLFSATMPGWICKLTDKHMVDPIFLDAVQEGDSRLAAEISHFAVPLPPVGDRFNSVVSCIEDLILTKGLWKCALCSNYSSSSECDFFLP